MRKDEDLEEIKKGNGLKNAKITENASDKNIKTIVVKKIPFNKSRRVTWQKSKRSTNRKGRGTKTVVRLSPELNVDDVGIIRTVRKSQGTGARTNVTHKVTYGGGTIKVVRKHPRVGNGAIYLMRLSRKNGGTTTTIRNNDNKKG